MPISVRKKVTLLSILAAAILVLVALFLFNQTPRADELGSPCESSVDSSSFSTNPDCISATSGMDTLVSEENCADPRTDRSFSCEPEDEVCEPDLMDDAVVCMADELSSLTSLSPGFLESLNPFSDLKKDPTQTQKETAQQALNLAANDILQSKLLNPYFTDPKYKDLKMKERLEKSLQNTFFKDIDDKKAGICKEDKSGQVEIDLHPCTLDYAQNQLRSLMVHELVHATDSAVYYDDPDYYKTFLEENLGYVSDNVIKKYGNEPLLEGMTELISRRIAQERGYKGYDSYSKEVKLALSVEQAIKRNLQAKYNLSGSTLDSTAERAFVSLLMYWGVHTPKFDAYLGQEGVYKELYRQLGTGDINKATKYIDSLHPKK